MHATACGKNMKSIIISTDNKIDETHVPPYRLSKALSITNKSERARSLCAGYLLGKALEENSIPVDTEPEFDNGKPYYADYPDFRFNLSHSGKYAAIIYNNEGIDVGIDIQERRPYRASLTRRVAGSKDEEADILKLWTIKEAYSKLTGRGIAMDFTKITYVDNCVVDLEGNILAYAKVDFNNDCYVCAMAGTEDILNLTFDGFALANNISL